MNYKFIWPYIILNYKKIKKNGSLTLPFQNSEMKLWGYPGFIRRKKQWKG